MPAIPSLLLAATLAVGCPGDQCPTPPKPAPVALPLPVGNPGPEDLVLREWTLTGWRPGAVWRFARQDGDGGGAEYAVPGGARTLVPTFQTDDSRTCRIDRCGLPTGVRSRVYLGNAWAADAEWELAPTGPRASAVLTYFPVEGLRVGVGFDTAAGGLIVRVGVEP